MTRKEKQEKSINSHKNKSYGIREKGRRNDSSKKKKSGRLSLLQKGWLVEGKGRVGRGREEETERVSSISLVGGSVLSRTGYGDGRRYLEVQGAGTMIGNGWYSMTLSRPPEIGISGPELGISLQRSAFFLFLLSYYIFLSHQDKSSFLAWSSGSFNIWL